MKNAKKVHVLTTAKKAEELSGFLKESGIHNKNIPAEQGGYGSTLRRVEFSANGKQQSTLTKGIFKRLNLTLAKSEI